MCGVGSSYPVGDIAKALKAAADLYDKDTIDNWEGEFGEDVRYELEVTILGLVKSLRIAAFNSSALK